MIKNNLNSAEIIEITKLDEMAHKEIQWWNLSKLSKLKQANKKGLLFLVKHKYKSIGFVRFDFRKQRRETIWLEDVYILSDYRTRGIAKKAILFAIRKLRSKHCFSKIKLECPLRLKDFYTKLGFEANHIVMTKMTRKIKCGVDKGGFLFNKKLNKVLLIMDHNGWWGFPKGGPLKGESYKETICREIKEETGITKCNLKQKLGVITHCWVSKSDQNRKTTTTYYLVETNQSKVTISKEHKDYKWLPLNKALKYLKDTKQRTILNKAKQIIIKQKHELSKA